MKIVTTNFDILFEKADSKLKTYLPPSLPQLHYGQDFDGIVYLHGSVNEDYTQAKTKDLILSSADFGNAYLSDGWATQFLKELLDRYYLVFVGYSADDPPVSYLLEALNKGPKTARIYSFQNENDDEGFEKWRAKGATAIGFKTYDLQWDTLRAWSKNEIYSKSWKKHCLTLARRDPKLLKPFERKQVLKFVQNEQGMKEFYELKPVAHPGWIFVFDPFIRLNGYKENVTYSSFNEIDPENQRNTYFSFFDHYHIPEDSENLFEENVDYKVTYIPMSALKIDMNEGDIWLGHFHTIVENFNLTRRQYILINWLIKNYNKKEIIYWFAFGIANLHIHPQFPYLFFNEVKELEKSKLTKTWQTLFHVANKDLASLSNMDYKSFYHFQDKLEKLGWCSYTLEVFSQIITPKINVKPSELTVNQFKGLEPKKLLDFNISYTKFDDLKKLKVVNQQDILNVMLRISSALEQGLNYESEYSLTPYLRHMGVNLFNIENDEPYYLSSEDSPNYSFYLAHLFLKLRDLDKYASEAILLSWMKHDYIDFIMLALWAFRFDYGKETAQKYWQLVIGLSDKIFFSFQIKRYLANSILVQWKYFDNNQRLEFEQKIVKGESESTKAKNHSKKQYNTYMALNWLEWLRSNDLDTSKDYSSLIEDLKTCLNLKESVNSENYFNEDFYGIKTGWVSTDEDYSAIINLPIKDIISTSYKLKKTKHTEVFREYNPFKGLIKADVKLAFEALKYEATQDNYPDWAWYDFLSESKNILNDKKFIREVFNFLCQLPIKELKNISNHIFSWVRELKVFKNFATKRSIHAFINKLIELSLSDDTNEQNKSKHFVLNASNSITNEIIDILFDLVRIQEGVFNHFFKKSFEKLLNKNNQNRGYAIYYLSKHLNWLHNKDRTWTLNNLIKYINDDSELIRSAFWLGLLTGTGIPYDYLFNDIKNELILFDINILDKYASNDYTYNYIAFITSGWITTQHKKNYVLIDDSEFRRFIYKYPNYLPQITETLERWSHDEVVRNLLPYFFREIYPKQNKFKIQKNNDHLLDILFESEENFVLTYEWIIPLLIPIRNQYSWIMLKLNHGENLIINNHPEKFLNFLSNILSDNVKLWPQGTEQILEKLISLDPSLQQHPDYLRLQSLWISR